MKKQSIGKYNSMIEEHIDVFHCEFGAQMPDYERGQNSLGIEFGLEISFNHCLPI